jgi:hypothetical protein
MKRFAASVRNGCNPPSAPGSRLRQRPCTHLSRSLGQPSMVRFDSFGRAATCRTGGPLVASFTCADASWRSLRNRAAGRNASNGRRRCCGCAGRGFSGDNLSKLILQIPNLKSGSLRAKCCGSVAGLLRFLLYFKCLAINDVADVAGFKTSYTNCYSVHLGFGESGFLGQAFKVSREDMSNALHVSRECSARFFWSRSASPSRPR